MLKLQNNIFRALSALTAVLIAASALPLHASEERIDAIVSVCEGFSPEECADEALGRFPGSSLNFVYDTLMNGFSIELSESQYLMLGSLGFVEGAAASGYYSLCETSRSEYAASVNSAVGIEAARAAGLDGSGVVVAVIDSGFDVDHTAFSGSAGSPKLSRDYIGSLLSNRSIHATRNGITVDDIYKNERIPFAFDYADSDADVSGALDHGTHVAGIIGAEYTPAGESEGMAPRCQLVLMKVFDENGSASDFALIAALEDAVRLGADVINLSLGRYSGSAERQLIPGMNGLLRRAEDAGCVIVCAAGNESTSSARSALAGSELKLGLPFSDYTDYGTVSYPASADYSLAVGSVDGEAVWGAYFLHGGEPVYYADTNKASKVLNSTFSSRFDGQTLRYAVVPGIGSEEDYAGLDVSGKLVLVSRGEITFVEKADVAASHGAVGVIIYNNVEDEIVNPELTGATIPAVSISKADGERLAASSIKRVSFDRDYIVIGRTEGVGEISAFSSWGCTPSLTLKPDICGVGGGVYSTTIDGYGGLSGTSMAAPQIAGACALLCQRLGGAMLISKRASSIKAALMNTADPVRQSDGVEYSPRAQGAGLADLGKALSQELSLTYTFNGKPKAELGDLLGERFWLGVTVKNLTDQPLEARLTATLTSDGYTVVEISDAEKYFSTLKAVPDRCSAILADGSGNLNRYSESCEPLVLTLDPGERREVELTFEIDRGYAESLSEVFTNGYFSEGFVCCKTDRAEYSLPYMGYTGDWSAAPILDADPDEGAVFRGTSVLTKVEGVYVRAGVNIFSEEQTKAIIAFSPDGNGAADTLCLRAELLRNASAGWLSVKDAGGEEVFRNDLGTYRSKSAGVSDPMLLFLAWDGSDGHNHRYKLPDGDYTLEFSFRLDFSDAVQTLSVPVRLDTKKPGIDSAVYDSDTGLLSITASDDCALQYVKLTNGGSDSFRQIETTSEPSLTAVFDLSGYDGDIFYIEAVDQAYNPVVEMFRLSELCS